MHITTMERTILSIVYICISNFGSIGRNFALRYNEFRFSFYNSFRFEDGLGWFRIFDIFFWWHASLFQLQSRHHVPSYLASRISLCSNASFLIFIIVLTGFTTFPYEKVILISVYLLFSSHYIWLYSFAGL